MTKKAEKQVEYTLATQAIENARPSKEAIRYCTEIAEGKTSAEQAVEKLMRKYGVKGARTHA